ncbi:hypothetical protein [Nonomuraea dietziae]|uniref:hypothetical protein n=1 Tax=Nonomuraea dietziae TaxID=65515 RepID=UPI0031D95811
MGTEAPAPVQAIQMAVLVVAIVPILLVYPFLQRYFTKGVLTGAIKASRARPPHDSPKEDT